MILKKLPELPNWAKKITITMFIRIIIFSLMFIEYLLYLPRILNTQQGVDSTIDTYIIFYFVFVSAIFFFLFIDILTVIFVFKQLNISKYLGITSSIILTALTAIFFTLTIIEFVRYTYHFHQDQVFCLVLLIASIFILIILFRNKFKPILSNKLGEPEFTNTDNNLI